MRTNFELVCDCVRNITSDLAPHTKETDDTIIYGITSDLENRRNKEIDYDLNITRVGEIKPLDIYVYTVKDILKGEKINDFIGEPIPSYMVTAMLFNDTKYINNILLLDEDTVKEKNVPYIINAISETIGDILFDGDKIVTSQLEGLIFIQYSIPYKIGSSGVIPALNREYSVYKDDVENFVDVYNKGLLACGDMILSTGNPIFESDTIIIPKFISDYTNRIMEFNKQCDNENDKVPLLQYK